MRKYLPGKTGGIPTGSIVTDPPAGPYGAPDVENVENYLTECSSRSAITDSRKSFSYRRNCRLLTESDPVQMKQFQP